MKNKITPEYINKELNRLNINLLSLAKSFSLKLINDKSLDIGFYKENADKMFSHFKLIKNINIDKDLTEQQKIDCIKKINYLYKNKIYRNIYILLQKVENFIFQSKNDLQSYRKIVKEFKELENNGIINYEENFIYIL